MYMKNTVSKEMKIKQQMTHVHLPQQKRSTRTPNQLQHYGTVTVESTQNFDTYVQRNPGIAQDMTSKQKQAYSRQLSGHQPHNIAGERQQQLPQTTQDEAISQIYNGQQSSTARGFSTNSVFVPTKAQQSSHLNTTTSINQQRKSNSMIVSQSSQNLLPSRVGHDIGGQPHTQSTYIQHQALSTQRHEPVRQKTQGTIQNRSDKKKNIKFINASETSPSLAQSHQQSTHGNNTDVINPKSSFYPVSDIKKSISPHLQSTNFGFVESKKRSGAANEKCTPTSTTAIRLSSTVSDGKAGESLYDHYQRTTTAVKPQMPTSRDSTTIKGKQYSTQTVKQEMRLEDLIETPKRLDEPAIQQAKLFGSQGGTQSKQRVPAISRTSSAECDSLPRYDPVHYQSRLQTEEGEGAQAIENNSSDSKDGKDYRDSVERQGGTTPQAEVYLGCAAVTQQMQSKAVVKRKGNARGKQYQYEDSSFGPQIANLQSRAKMSDDEDEEEVNIGSLSEDELEDENDEVIVRAYNNQLAEQTLELQNRSRTTCHKSLKHLFSKSLQANESSSVGLDQNQAYDSKFILISTVRDQVKESINAQCSKQEQLGRNIQAQQKKFDQKQQPPVLNFQYVLEKRDEN